MAIPCAKLPKRSLKTRRNIDPSLGLIAEFVVVAGVAVAILRLWLPH